MYKVCVYGDQNTIIETFETHSYDESKKIFIDKISESIPPYKIEVLISIKSEYVPDCGESLIFTFTRNSNIYEF